MVMMMKKEVLEQFVKNVYRGMGWDYKVVNK
jgi:hypothetical protein